MMSSVRLLSTAVLICAISPAQTGSPHFEVASVRMAERGCSPQQNISPTRLTYTCARLFDVIVEAYSTAAYRTAGFDKIPPITFVSISANMPEGTTKEQRLLMLQNLLEERFQLKVHRETREGNAFELTAEKSGHKLRENTSNPAPADPEKPLPVGKMDDYGLPELPNEAGHVRYYMTPGKARAKGYAAPLVELTTVLEPFLRGPISDQTGLTGKYDFTLEFEGPQFSMVLADGTIQQTTAQEFFPPIPKALSKQLGLHLEQKKLPVDFLVLTSIDLKLKEN